MTWSLPLPRPDRLFAPGWLAVGFFYWLALVCALEPGNLAGAAQPVSPWREITRLLAAATLGGAATPAVLALARRGLLARALGVLAIAFALIVISCLLAAWLLEQRAAPSLAEIREELAANFLLLVFGLSVFLGLASLGPTRPSPASSVDRLIVSERGHTLVLDLAQIEWVESQGNYQAVRAGGATHLVRRTLVALEADLGPERLVRIHRRTLVGLAFIRSLSALDNGDAEVRMTDGRILRVARSRRARLAAALEAAANPKV